MTPSLWWFSGIGAGLLVVFAVLVCVSSVWMAGVQDEMAAKRLLAIELPTWTEADEVAADKSYDDALREWQQSVELPRARPLSRSGVNRLRRDLRKPIRLTQAEAEHVREILFPRSRRTPKEVA